MDHVMRAEYAEPEHTVRSWHMVREQELPALAMCGRELDAEAEVRPDSDWGRTAEPMCHTCGALYLREVP